MELTKSIYEYEDLQNGIVERIKSSLLPKTLVKIETKTKKKTYVDYWYNYPCSFDTETTTLDAYESWNQTDEPIGFTYLYQFNLFGRVFFFRHYYEVINFLDKVADVFQTDEKRLVIYVHNLSYEFQFIKDWIDIDAESVFAVEKRKVIKFKDKRGIEYRDSYKLTNMSLEKLTEDYSIKYKKKKEIMDYSEYRDPYSDLDINTIEYSALDVLSLSDALQGFMNANNFHIWDTIYTSTGIVRTDVREHMFTHSWKATHSLINRTRLNKELYLLMQDLKAGGNTHANREHVGKILYNLGHGDFTSSYPYQMICNRSYPVGKWEKVELMKDGMFDWNKYHMYVTSNVVIGRFTFENLRLRKDKYIPIPYISASRALSTGFTYNQYGYDNGRILSTSGFSTFAFYDEEFIHCVLSQYEWDSLIASDCYISKKGHIIYTLREKVFEYYQKKTELKGIESKKYEYMKSKNCVNGIFGMCYTDPIQETIIFNEDIMQLEKDCKKIDIDEALEKYYNSPKTFLPYQWGSYTAMLGRVALQSMIDLFDSHDVVYVDTDSCFFLHPEKYQDSINEYNQKLLAKYDIEKSGVPNYAKTKKGSIKYLGIIDMEDNADEFVTLGAKKYAQVIGTKFEITIAGVPKSKGSVEMETIDNFHCGFVFKDCDKKRLRYNDERTIRRVTTDKGSFDVFSNIAMLDTTYELDITDEFESLINFIQSGRENVYNFL